MRIRTRLLTGGVILVLVPLAGLGWMIRSDVAARLEGQYAERVDAFADAVRVDLQRRDEHLRAALATLAADLREDDAVRRSLDAARAGDEGVKERGALLDWAPRTMPLAGLDVLLLQDEDGRILSSGHYRQDWGRVDARTRTLLGSGSVAVVPFPLARGPVLAFACADTVRLAGRTLLLTAGSRLDAAELAALSPDPGVTVTLLHPDGAVSPDSALAASLPADPAVALRELRADPDRRVRLLPVPSPGGEAALVVVQSLAPLREVVRATDLRLALAWGLAAAGTLLLAALLSSSIARPIERLAERTREIALDRLQFDASKAGRDEVGTLTRFLADMTERLRAGVTRLRDAERRATLGELARQVNHDVRNAFTPLRNVVRHLSEVAESTPADLPRVYAERRPTLDAGLAYLEDLATNWSRLSQRTDRETVDVADVVRAVAAGRGAEDGGPVHLQLAPDASAWATPHGLRRIVENLVANACDTLESGATRVDVSVETYEEDHRPWVRVIVADDGPGLPDGVRQKVFDAFYTTKPGGSGLGLSIVRRIVSDFEGRVTVESGPGTGAAFIVVLPGRAAEREMAPPPALPPRRPGDAS
jgi:signal transduction histidine kinase